MSLPPFDDSDAPPPLGRRGLLRAGLGALSGWGLAGCTSMPASRSPVSSGTWGPVAVGTTPLAPNPPAALQGPINRLGWGATPAQMGQVQRMGYATYVEAQLRPPGDVVLAASIQAQIDALSISRQPMTALVEQTDALRKRVDALTGEEDRQAARRAYQQALTRLGREAATRQLLRAVYSPWQLHEHLGWFWLNHFNVHQHKRDIRAMVGDYEEAAIRPHALGRFAALLRAATKHPAMLRYLDNDQNAVGRLNENHARELLELHTLGVDGGYAQRDVQELARVLTGFGVAVGPPREPPRGEHAALYRRDGLFEFNPKRHDFGDKQVLGRTVVGGGVVELDGMLDRLAAHPATARFLSRKLAVYLLGDDPPARVVDAMTARYLHSQGDIAAVVRVLLLSSEFTAGTTSGAGKFKDPMHYVVSAVRLGSDPATPLRNTQPILGWLQRLGQAPYNRQTPDGYPGAGVAWIGSGQMSTRFDIARAIGSGARALYAADPDSPAPNPMPDPPAPVDLRLRVAAADLGADTRSALDEAGSLAQRNALLLSSPEFMVR